MKIEVLKKSNNTWDGTALPSIHLDSPCITMVKYTIEAGEELPRHKHPLMQAGYIISGQLTVYKDGGDTIDLKAGDTCIELFEQWHCGKNNGNIQTTIIVFNIGAEDTPLSILADID